VFKSSIVLAPTLLNGGSLGSRPGQFNGTTGIAVDLSGNVYVTDWNNNRVEKFGSVATISVEQVVLIIVIAVIIGSIGAYLTMRKRSWNLNQFRHA
jgi:DNA-binding beta-propeller fold protein YncE